VVKYGVIRSEEFLKYVEVQVGNVLAGDPAVLEHVVAESCRIKAEVVAADPREKGLRAILNFGHTVGHAMEAARGYGSWLHGECVAVGMVAAAAIARHSGILQDTDLQVRLERDPERLGLPTRLPSGLEPQELEPFLRRDKKVRDGLIHWVLPLRAGEVTVTPNVAPEAVRWGLESVRR
jgi:3-dehydroquinate synthase